MITSLKKFEINVKSEIFSESNEKYLVLKGESGMGNRLLAFVAALAYCKITGRKLFVDWTDGMYADNRENAFHLLFDSPFVDPKLKLPKTNSVFPPVWNGNIDKSIDDLEGTNAYKREIPTKILAEKYSCDLSKIDYPERIVVFFDCTYPAEKLANNISKISGWPLKREEAVRFALNKYLFPKKSISDAVNDFKNKKFKNKTIGLHIRYTDNLTHKHMDLSVSLREYKKALLRLLKEDPSLNIFLCTDNQFIEDEYKKKYKNILVTDKLRSKNVGDCMHYLAIPGERLRMAKEALIDMYLLSQCDYLIYYYSSSFSRLASFLSKPETKKIRLSKKSFIAKLLGITTFFNSQKHKNK